MDAPERPESTRGNRPAEWEDARPAVSPVHHHLVLGAVLLLCACTTHSGSRRSVYRGVTVLPSTGIQSIVVRNGAGSVRVVAAHDDAITLDVDVLLDEARPQLDAQKNVLDHVLVHSTDSRVEFVDAHASKGDANDWELRITLHVPAGRSLEIDQGMGEVTVVLPDTRDLRVANASGSIHAQVAVVDGALDLRVQQGEVEAEVRDRIAGEANVETVTGQASLALPAAVEGSFELSCATGELQVAGRYGLPVERLGQGARAHGRVGERASTHRLRVSQGSAVLR